MTKSITNRQEKFSAWEKAIKMAQYYEDLLICCEDSSDIEYLEQEEKAWNEKARTLRATYTLS